MKLVYWSDFSWPRIHSWDRGFCKYRISDWPSWRMDWAGSPFCGNFGLQRIEQRPVYAYPVSGGTYEYAYRTLHP